MRIAAPERIWAGEGEYWHKPHVANPTAEYILHTRAALAASPVVQEIVAEAVRAEREALSSSPVAVSIAPETDAKAEAQLRAIRAFMCAPAHGSKPDQEISKPQEKGE